MKPIQRALALVIILGGAVPASAADPAPGSKPQPRISVPRLERAIHDLVNRERRGQRLAPLGWDAPLAAVARGHSGDMARRSYFSHESPEGAGFGERYRKRKYTCARQVGPLIHLGAENIAQMTLYASVTTLNGVKYYDWNPEAKIARDTVAGWMASPGHRANILTGHWRRQGIGLAIAADGKVYVTQNFC